jgi:serine/threonine-protein kinase
MSEKGKPSLPVPLIAVALMAVAWVAVIFWPESPTAMPPEVVDPVKADRIDWSTYHGGPSLAGVISTSLPEQLVEKWYFQADAPIYNAPVSSGDHLLFCTSKGGVYAIDFEGNEVWSKHLERDPKADGTPRMESFDAPPACFDGTLLVGSMAGNLYAFDAQTGEQKWKYTVDGPILGTANLHRSDDPGDTGSVLVIGSSDGVLHSVDLVTGKGLWQSEAIARCDGSPSVMGDEIVFGSCATALHVLSALDGSLVKNIEIVPESQIAAGVALVGVSAFSGNLSGNLIHANIETGEIVWLNSDSEYEVYTTPAVSEDWVVFASDEGIVHGLDRDTGVQQWKYDTDGGLPYSVVIAGDKVVFPADGVVYLLRLETGELLWSQEVSDEITSPAIINGMVVVGSDDGTVTAFGAK